MKRAILCAIALTALVGIAQAQSDVGVVRQSNAIYTIDHKSRITALGDEQDRQIAQLKYRVDELERQMAGVQNQVTILHAKGEDSADILAKVTAAITRRVYRLEQKVK